MSELDKLRLRDQISNIGLYIESKRRTIAQLEEKRAAAERDQGRAIARATELRAELGPMWLAASQQGRIDYSPMTGHSARETGPRMPSDIRSLVDEWERLGADEAQAAIAEGKYRSEIEWWAEVVRARTVLLEEVRAKLAEMDAVPA